MAAGQPIPMVDPASSSHAPLAQFPPLPNQNTTPTSMLLFQYILYFTTPDVVIFTVKFFTFV